MDMCRFTGLDDAEYKKVASALLRMTPAATSQPAKGQTLVLNEEQRRVLLESLGFVQIDARQMTIKKHTLRRVNGCWQTPNISTGSTPVSSRNTMVSCGSKGSPGLGSRL